MSKFKAYYEVDDGYIDYSSPVFFYIDKDDLDKFMDVNDLDELYDECMNEHFQNNIFPYARNKNEFIKWAKTIINKRKDNE